MVPEYLPMIQRKLIFFGLCGLENSPYMPSVKVNKPSKHFRRVIGKNLSPLKLRQMTLTSGLKNYNDSCAIFKEICPNFQIILEAQLL